MKNIQFFSPETDRKILQRLIESVPYVVFGFFVMIFFAALSKHGHLLRFRNGQHLLREQSVFIFVYFLMVIVSGYGAFKRAQIDWQQWKSKPHQGRFRKRRILVWMVRAMYISVILAICDVWTAGTKRDFTLFSKNTWEMSDGGTKGYIGFGYSMIYFRRLGGEPFGPVIWFWFTPVVVDATGHRGIQVRWLWSH